MLPAAAGERASAPSAASSCRSRTAPASAMRRSTRPRKAFMAKACADAGAGRAVLELPGQRAAALCRHRPHQGAAARRAGARACSTRCRSISARSTSTTSTSSAAPIRCVCRPTRSSARAPTTSAQLKVRSDTGEMVPLSARAAGQGERRAGARHALQRLPRRRHQRRRRRPAIRPGRRRTRSSASPPRRCRRASRSNGPT